MEADVFLEGFKRIIDDGDSSVYKIILKPDHMIT